MQIHDLPNGTIGATEYAPIDNGTTNRKTTLSAIGTYIINNVTEALGGVTRTLKAAIDAAWTKLGSGSISNVGADVSAAIGNDALGTTATSLSGAIAEHEGDITALGEAVENITYANGTRIPANSDLNNYMTAGAYFAGTAADAQTLTNCPTSASFRLEVKYTANSNRLIQVMYANGSAANIFIRAYTGSWNGWRQVTTTAV